MSLYLWLNILTILFPLIASFEKKINYYSNWKYLFPAIFIVYIPFIIWDAIFTSQGVWGFNSAYLNDVKLFGLPIEEHLFFICIPFSCVFIYECVKYQWYQFYNTNSSWVNMFAIALFLTGGIFLSKSYTSVTFFSLAVLLVILVFYRVKYLNLFFLAYLFILIPFFIVNGILTGSFIHNEVVWYNNEENMGVRLFTIPIEDTFYGMLLILLNVVVYEYLKKKY